MINEPPIDELTSKIGEKYEGSKYAFCVIVSKRARQLNDIAKNQNASVLNNQKPLTAAANEVYDGKITATNS
jgi:DNA-directed RNA polymerase omega subunit